MTRKRPDTPAKKICTFFFFGAIEMQTNREKSTTDKRTQTKHTHKKRDENKYMCVTKNSQKTLCVIGRRDARNEKGVDAMPHTKEHVKKRGDERSKWVVGWRGKNIPFL